MSDDPLERDEEVGAPSVYNAPVAPAADLRDRAMGAEARREVYQGPIERQQRADERIRSEISLGDAVSMGFQETAVYGVGRLVNQEGLGALIGIEEGPADYDKYERYDELTEGIPYSLHDEILVYDNFAAAMRARARVLADLERGQRLARTRGVNGIAAFAGSMLDADLPLMFVTGGGYKAAQVSRQALLAAERLGVSADWARRASSVAVGANAGLQSGLIVGAVDAHAREVRDWGDIPALALESMAFGGTLNGVLKGDSLLAARVARDEFLNRIRTNDPNLRADPVVDPSTARPIRTEPATPDIQGDEPSMTGASRPAAVLRVDGVDVPRQDRTLQDEIQSTAGAQQVGSAPGVRRTPRPQSGFPDDVETIIRDSEDWRHDSDWDEIKDVESTQWWARIAHSRMATRATGTNMFRVMYKSDSAVLNRLAGVVAESANGLGRGTYTAATGMEAYHRRILSPVTREYTGASRAWASAHGYTLYGTGRGISRKGLRLFNREVRLELNDRAHNRASNRHSAVVRAADAFEAGGEEAYRIAKGENGQLPVDGFENVPWRRGYQPYSWSGSRMHQIITAGQATEADIVRGMANAYRAAGLVGVDGEDIAEEVAAAVVRRALAGELNQVTDVAHMLSRDGRDFIAESLRASGVSEHRVSSILNALGGDMAERGRQGFAKSRNEIDLNGVIRTSDGSDLRVVDLFDEDLSQSWQRYARQVSGSSALARVGITNRATRERIIAAVQAEQRALGETGDRAINPDWLRSLFSHFDGGPIRGTDIVSGKLNDGVGSTVSLAKQTTGLSLLNKMGIPQLAEAGVVIAQQGLVDWWHRYGGAVFDRKLRENNQGLLDDLACMLGDIGEDHVHFAPHMELDEVSGRERSQFIRTLQRLSRKGTWIQGYASLFNFVKGQEQKIAVMAMSDKVMRALNDSLESTGGFGTSGVPPKLLERFRSDFGLGPEQLRQLENLIESGVIEFETRGNRQYVHRLNMHKWPVQLREEFASGVTRHMNQVVQHGLAGEVDPWMSSSVGAVFTHLKTFPMLAFQKQAMRNLRHTDSQTLGTVMYGMATAYLMLSVRDALDGRESDVEDRARRAFGYANVTGWVPMYADPVLTMLGLEDYRFSPYGKHTTLTPPVITQVNRALRLPGAVHDKLTGQDDYYDRDSIRALPFYNVYVLNNILR